MIREALATLAHNESVGGVLARTPVARDVLARVVAGEQVADAVAAAARLADDGFWTAVEYTSPATPSVEEAERCARAHVELLDALAVADATAACEVAVLPEALGARIDPEQAFARVAAVVEQAAGLGISVRLGFGPATDVEHNLAVAQRIWTSGTEIGLTLPAAWRRAEVECERLCDHSIRLVKGTVRVADPGVHSQPIEIDKAFVRCARRLARGSGEASFATHDPRLIAIVEDLVARAERPRSTYEYVLFMGRQESEQQRLAAAGDRVRVYVPYGPQWFERLVAGLAEQPSGVVSAVRSLLPWS